MKLRDNGDGGITSICEECGKELQKIGDLNPLLIYEVRDGVRYSCDAFCSRSCLSEYLKPKTETTP